MIVYISPSAFYEDCFYILPDLAALRKDQRVYDRERHRISKTIEAIRMVRDVSLHRIMEASHNASVTCHEPWKRRARMLEASRLVQAAGYEVVITAMPRYTV